MLDFAKSVARLRRVRMRRRHLGKNGYCADFLRGERIAMDLIKVSCSSVGSVLISDDWAPRFIERPAQANILMEAVAERTRWILEYCLGKSALTFPDVVFQPAIYVHPEDGEPCGRIVRPACNALSL